MEWEQVGQGKATYSAKFKDLNRVDIEASAHPDAKSGDTLIRYFCADGSKCVDTNFGFFPPGHYMFPGFSHEVCSREVAEDIKVAVETLIKSNASGAPPAEPQKSAPRADRPEVNPNPIVSTPRQEIDEPMNLDGIQPKATKKAVVPKADRPEANTNRITSAPQQAIDEPMDLDGIKPKATKKKGRRRDDFELKPMDLR
jgi:hypothetical protein